MVSRAHTDKEAAAPVVVDVPKMAAMPPEILWVVSEEVPMAPAAGAARIVSATVPVQILAAVVAVVPGMVVVRPPNNSPAMVVRVLLSSGRFIDIY